MAESALEKLMRLAKEKKAASASPVVATQPISIAASAEGGASDPVIEQTKQLTKDELIELVTPNTEANLEARFAIAAQAVTNETPKSLAEPVATSDHPLAMQFAELEQALLAQQPEFKTILRQIHRHLGQEPELVTQMTEQEIQLIVSGLVVFANAEIVAPAAEKSAKAKIAAAKKQPISADDL